MNLPRLLRWDFLHLQRNQMIAVSLGVGAAYLGILYLLPPAARTAELLIVMIFNDPIVMSYFFAGALLLFEKDQRTLDALRVTPLSSGLYLWSRGLALALTATLVAFLMVWAGFGTRVNYLPFVAGTLGSSLLLAWLGCLIGRLSAGFNAFLVRSIGVFLPMALPLLLLFEGWNNPLLYLIPSAPGVLLLKASFEPLAAWQYVYSYAFLLLALAGVFFRCRKTLEAS